MFRICKVASNIMVIWRGRAGYGQGWWLVITHRDRERKKKIGHPDCRFRHWQDLLSSGRLCCWIVIVIIAEMLNVMRITNNNIRVL